MTLTDSIVSNNFSNIFGAGIGNEGRLTLFRSTVKDNVITGSPSGGGETASGGGIFNGTKDATRSSIFDGQVSIVESTISGNQSTRGGGISNGSPFSLVGSLLMLNSTITGNKAFKRGGGIINFGDSRIQINGSTITANLV